MIKLIDLDELDCDDAIILGKFLAKFADEYGGMDNYEIKQVKDPLYGDIFIAIAMKESRTVYAFVNASNNGEEWYINDLRYILCDYCDNAALRRDALNNTPDFVYCSLHCLDMGAG